MTDDIAESSAQVSLSQVARLAGVGPSAVSNWRRRFPDFPAPVETTAEGNDLFALAAVLRWLDANGRGSAKRLHELLFLEIAELLRSFGSSEQLTEWVCSAVSVVFVARARGIDSPRQLQQDLTSDTLVRHVEASARDQVEGLFSPLAELPRESRVSLLAMVQPLDQPGLRQLFEWALSRRSRFVESRTPDSVADLIATLAMATSASFFDPAAGEGGFLLAARRLAIGRAALYGQEINESAWRIARQRLLVHDVTEAAVRLGNSLRDDAFPDLLVDAVVCDPPYGLDPRWDGEIWADQRWAFGIPPSKNADFAWIQHAIHHLNSSGRAYVVLPAGTLHRRGQEAEIRRELVRRGAVECIVSLPPGTAERTSVPLALWIVRHPPTGEAPLPILFVDAGLGGPTKGGGLDVQTADRIATAVHTWRLHGCSVNRDETWARPVAIAKLLAGDANLLPSRWLRPPAEIDEQDRRRQLTEAIAQMERARRALADAAVDVNRLSVLGSPSNWISLRGLLAADAAEIIRGSRIRSEDCNGDGVVALRTQDVRAGIDHLTDPCRVPLETLSPRPRLTEPGDIIVSPGGGKPLAVVDTRGGHVLASPLQALRIKSAAVDRRVIAAFLEAPRNRRFVEGTTYGYARLDISDLEIPALASEEASRLGGALRQIDDLTRLATEIVDNATKARELVIGVSSLNDSNVVGDLSQGDAEPRRTAITSRDEDGVHDANG